MGTYRVNFSFPIVNSNRLIKALHACQKEGVRGESHGIPRIQLQSAEELPFRAGKIVMRMQPRTGGRAMCFREIVIELERLQGGSLRLWKSDARRSLVPQRH